MKEKKFQILKKKFTSPIVCLATYSAPVAKILDGNVDLILIGDSLGTTLYGMKNTQSVTLDMMKNHGLAVVKNIKKSITVIDMPHKTYENKTQALINARKILNHTKADMIKIEIDKNKLDIVKYLSNKNINVVAHIGVTPQIYRDFSKIKIRGRTKNDKKILINLALKSEIYGAKAILLECIAEKTAKTITSSITIPTIGIGASKYCNGQILVFDDLINLNLNKKPPRFVKNFMDFTKQSKDAVRKFARDVKSKKFPNKKNTYQ